MNWVFTQSAARNGHLAVYHPERNEQLHRTEPLTERITFCSWIFIALDLSVFLCYQK